jgi:flavin reductase (DIM6/NTAB) family NADH-FMN oxidoreductase RutF
MPMDRALFREIFAALPTTVAVITALDRAGVPRGLTSNTVCAVSEDPPLLLICVDRRSQTLPALLHSGAFVVNFLAEHAEHVSRVFAGKGEAKFERLHTVRSRHAGGAPILLDNLIAHAECVLHDSVEAGDHWILLGRIEDGAVYEHAPLMYFRRGYAAWSPDAALVRAALGARSDDG